MRQIIRSNSKGHDFPDVEDELDELVSQEAYKKINDLHQRAKNSQKREFT